MTSSRWTLQDSTPMLEQLHSLFADVERPTREELGAKDTEEWGYSLDFLAGKTWQEVTIDDFEDNDGLLTIVTTFSTKGILYFIPGLIRNLLETEDEDTWYFITHGLLNFFTCPDYLEPGKESVVAIKELSSEKRTFIADILQKYGSAIDTLCPVLLESAIDNLNKGEINRFSQKEVEAWVKDWAECFEKQQSGHQS